MTAAQQVASDLAALVKAGRIRSAWVAGMADECGDRVLTINASGTITTSDIVEKDRSYYSDTTHGEYDASLYPPDLSDPLTVMGLVLLLREATGDPLVHVGWYARQWRVWSTTKRLDRVEAWSSAPTEAEALAAALHAIALECAE